MKKTSAILATVLLCASAWGQGSLKEVIGLLRGKNTISCTYSYEMKGDVPLKDSGSALLLGHKYHTTSNGIEIWSDGTTTWTVDKDAKEVYIAPAGESMISHLEDFVGMVHGLNYDGKSLSCSIVSKDKGIDIKFRADDIVISPATRDDALFSFDTSKLDPSWIVTDLR